MTNEEYLDKLLDSKLWFINALQQKKIGDQILDKCIMNKDFLNKAKYNYTEYTSFWSNVHYHYGIGIENGLKGLIIHDAPDKVHYELSPIGDLLLKNIGGKSGKSHDLLSIAENAGLFSQKYKPFKHQQDLKTLRIVLQHLSDMVIWGARYPVPNGSNKYFKFDNSVPLILVYGFHILDVIEPVFNLFEMELLKLNK